MKRLPAVYAVLICIFSVPEAFAGEGGTPPEPATPKCGVAPYFDCRAPKGWWPHHDPDYSAKISKTFGVNIVGPKAPGGGLVSIDAVYYAPGNGTHSTPKAFIKAVGMLDGDIHLPGEKATPPSPAVYKGLAATRFTRSTFDFVRVSDTSEKQVAVEEEYLVVPARKGFYVLEFRAPPEVFKENRQAYEAFLRSFTMLVK